MPITDEELPEYCPLYCGNKLPSYRPNIKEFVVKHQLSLLTKIVNMKWFIKEKDSCLTWFEIHPTKRGLLLVDTENEIHLESILLPINNLGFGFIVKEPKSNENKAEIQPIGNQSYKVKLYPSQVNSNCAKSYIIQRIPPRYSNLHFWKVYNEDDSINAICSFNISTNFKHLASIRFKSLKVLEFQPFFLICCQVISVFHS